MDSQISSIINTSIDDARSTIQCGLDNGTLRESTLRNALRAEKAKGSQARSAMIRAIETGLNQLEKRSRAVATRPPRASGTAAVAIPEVEPVVIDAEMPGWFRSEAQESMREAVRYHRAADLCIRGFAFNVVLCGTELLTLRKQVGAGHWGDVVDRYLVPQYGMSDRSIRRYMQVAEGARKRLRQTTDGDVDTLRLLGNGSPDSEAMQTVHKAIADTTDANNWRELLEDFHLTRPKGRGGFHPPRQYIEAFAKARHLDPDYTAWTDEERDEFRAWLKEERRREDADADAADPMRHEKRRLATAEKIWMPFLTQARLGTTTEGSWSILPAGSRAELRDALLKLAGMLNASL